MTDALFFIFFTATAAETAAFVSVFVLRSVLTVLMEDFAISVSAFTVTSPVAASFPFAPTSTVAAFLKLPTMTEAPISTYSFHPVAFFSSSFFSFSSDDFSCSSSVSPSPFISVFSSLSVSVVPFSSFTASVSPEVADIFSSISLMAAKIPLAASSDSSSLPRSAFKAAAAEISSSSAGAVASVSMTFSFTESSSAEVSPDVSPEPLPDVSPDPPDESPEEEPPEDESPDSTFS